MDYSNYELGLMWLIFKTLPTLYTISLNIKQQKLISGISDSGTLVYRSLAAQKSQLASYIWGKGTWCTSDCCLECTCCRG